MPVNIDKYGKPIYSKPFAEIVKNAKKLNNNGYIESYNKPNLFYKKIPEGILFADMRSSEVIPIWEDTRPLFYWKFNDDIPLWKRRRLIKNEMIQLFNAECPCRLSFYAHYRTEELEQTSCYISESEGIFEWHDGHCMNCLRDIQSNDRFCSDECKQLYEDSFKRSCKICHKKLDWKEEIGHHLDYGNDVTIVVCRSCHAKVHLSDDYEYEQYRPLDKRPKKESKYMLVPCAGGCGKKVRVLKEEYNPNEAYSCYKCNKEAERWNNKMKQMREKKYGRQTYIEWWRKHG